MSGTGRPLRFLALLSGGWVVLRTAMLWPQIDSVEALTRAIVPLATAAAPQPTPVAPPIAHLPSLPRPRAHMWRTLVAAPAAARRKPDPERVALALLGLTRFGGAQYVEPGIVAGLPPQTAVPPTMSRWSGSAWLVARGAGMGATNGLVGGQLGGSQAGLRLAYALEHTVALAARFSSPLGAGGREIAAGIEWRPTSVPVRIVAEQRVAVGGGRGGSVIGVVGGFGPRSIGQGFRGEAYGQAGFIARDGGEGFADGALRVSRAAATLGRVRFDLGGGAWGAAQRGAARLDIGPSASISLPIGGTATRLSLDWRERVAGRARPGSGLVVTLGADF